LYVLPYNSLVLIKDKKGGSMKLVKIVLVVFAAGMILACSSAEKKAYKSQTAVNEERIELTDKYQECMKKAGDDQAKQAQCEQYLKAAEALK
jgi:hypothetical protein